MTSPRTAIVHYWLVSMRGGERVLERLLKLYPGADIITHVYNPEAVSGFIRSHRVRTTFINKLPGAQRHYQKYLPLMPLALEEIDMRGYDLVISSESGPAKGIIVPPDAFHMCYCHSPMRYLWDHYHQYKLTGGRFTKLAMPLLMHRLRQWDISSAQRVDSIVANSNFIARRVKKSWGRQADVVHPPIEVSLFRKSDDVQNQYLWVGQMTPYKRADIVVDAFTKLGLPLLMVGTGELAGDIAKRAGPNIKILERLDFADLRKAYAECRALIFPPEEDFGIVPVEANAAGRPVIAYGRGGIRDSIIPDHTGLFFEEQHPDALIDAVERFEQWLPQFNPDVAVQNAERFAPEIFDAKVKKIISAGIGLSNSQSGGETDGIVERASVL
ncbi:MAG: glycosyltransferase [Parasphingorhabdus sp.]|uniref:glycosyltransferase n=1 Tax=Parasphingorhabdus sp. TaxID=2709688 RepID=UPI0030021E9D